MNRTMRRRPGVIKAACLGVAGLLIVACSGFMETTNACVAAEAQCGGCDKSADAKQAQPAKGKKANQPAASDNSGGAKPRRPEAVIQRSSAASGVRATPRSRQAQDPKVATEPPWPGWACKDDVLTLEPLWAGQPLTATWVIQNEGEGDLEIKIRGG